MRIVPFYMIDYILRKLSITGYRNAKALWRRALEVMKGSLALTYFLTRIGQYHWRGGVSRSCSRWEGVVPPCYGHQTKLV